MAARGGRPAKRERARVRARQQQRVGEAAEFWSQRKVDADAADTRTELRTDARSREQHEDVGAPHHRTLLWVWHACEGKQVETENYTTEDLNGKKKQTFTEEFSAADVPF